MGRNEALSLDHVALKSLDIQRDKEWYCKIFNCSVEYSDDTWASLLLPGGGRIALVTPSQHPPHIAILQSESAPNDVKPHRDGTFSKYVKDPSGNLVELLWRA